jgi:hypothetical protein
MRIFASLVAAAALTVTIVACSGPTKKKVEPGTTEGSDSASETCCCKSNPISADDGKPIYETGGRMECSSKQGECVPEVQCAQSPQPD